MSCVHLEMMKPESIYIFELKCKQTLSLCTYCFQELARKIVEQLVLESCSQDVVNKFTKIDIEAVDKRIDNLRDLVLKMYNQDLRNKIKQKLKEKK